MSEQMAIIRDVGIGAGDRGIPCLWFSTYVTESSAALQVIDWTDAFELLKAVDRVEQLNGKPCWVEVDGNMIRFLRLWKP